MATNHIKPAKVSKSYIQSLVDAGIAEDLTTLSDAAVQSVRASLALVSYSIGLYGTTSALFAHIRTGKLYAVPSCPETLGRAGGVRLKKDLRPPSGGHIMEGEKVKQTDLNKMFDLIWIYCD